MSTNKKYAITILTEKKGPIEVIYNTNDMELELFEKKLTEEYGNFITISSKEIK